MDNQARPSYLAKVIFQRTHDYLHAPVFPTNLPIGIQHDEFQTLRDLYIAKWPQVSEWIEKLRAEDQISQYQGIYHLHHLFFHNDMGKLFLPEYEGLSLTKDKQRMRKFKLEVFRLFVTAFEHDEPPRTRDLNYYLLSESAKTIMAHSPKQTKFYIDHVREFKGWVRTYTVIFLTKDMLSDVLSRLVEI